MLWADAALKTVAFAASIIATLQASSRGLYLLQHDAIGVMDGPLIQNRSTSLFELSEMFRHAVWLSMTDGAIYDANVTIRDASSTFLVGDADEKQAGGSSGSSSKKATIREPYSLYPRPFLEDPAASSSSATGRKAGDSATSAQQEDTSPNDSVVPFDAEKSSLDAFLDAQVNQFLEDADRDMAAADEGGDGNADDVKGSADSSSHAASSDRGNNPDGRGWRHLGSAFKQAAQPTWGATSHFVQESPKVVSYWTKWAWYKAQGKRMVPTNATSEASGLDLDGSDSDYNLMRQIQLSFNSSVTNEDTTYTISAYAPKTFQFLRNLFGIRDIDYNFSMSSDAFVSFQSNSKGAARAGGVFFFTRDGAYMIKTIKKEEVGALLRMLPKYRTHMKRFGRSSLLTRFCGMYSIQMDGGTQQTIVVMNSVFPAEASKFVAERYDLKGSTVGREVSEEEKQKKGRNAVLKDLDLAREVNLVKAVGRGRHTTMHTHSQQPSYGFHIGATAKAALLSQLRQDVKLLVDCQVMDYSLLVGVVLMDEHLLRLDATEQRALDVTQQNQGALVLADAASISLARMRGKRKVDTELFMALATPVRLLLSPTVYLSRKIWQRARRTVSSILTLPMPYYGADRCVVDGGSLATLHGTRRGQRAVYFMGLIDFLQPWSTRKVWERKLKGWIGQDINAVSCVAPEEYADRFLRFMDENIS